MLSRFNFHAPHQCPFRGLLNATFFPLPFLCFFLATSLCKMAPGTGPKGRTVVVRPTETLCE